METLQVSLFHSAPQPDLTPRSRACHLSACNVTVALYRSTLQRACRPLQTGVSSDGSPSDVGLHELSASDVHGPYVTARPVSSYLTFSPLPRNRILLPTFPYGKTNRKMVGRLFSSVRIHPYGRLPVKKQITLCCPDFPPVTLYALPLSCRQQNGGLHAASHATVS